LPTSRRTESCGSRVSESRVMTKRTWSGRAERPGRSRKLVSVARRNSRFISCSLPRLRSQPIQLPSPAFHTRRRCSTRTRSPPGPGPCRRLRRAIPSGAAARSASSPAACSVSLSVQSESKAKCNAPSWLARKWSSSRATCSAMDWGVVSSVGTATSVRKLAGMPSRNSNPGREVAPNAHIASRLMQATAASEAGTKPSRPSGISHAGSVPASAHSQTGRAITKPASATTAAP